MSARVAMPSDAADAVRVLAAMGQARCRRDHVGAEAVLEGLSLEQTRAALRWSIPAVEEALRTGPGVEPSAFWTMAAGSAESWDGRSVPDEQIGREPGDEVE